LLFSLRGGKIVSVLFDTSCIQGLRKMKTIIDFLRDNHIEFYGVLPLSLVTVYRDYLYKKYDGFTPQSVLMLLFPYYAGETENISRYASGYDYHAFSEDFFTRFTAFLKDIFPDNSFYGYADRSPIDERVAAAKAHLGVLGRNGLLINEKHSSFVFLGEILSDLIPEAYGLPLSDGTVRYCIGCNACKNACPTGILAGKCDICLSALTQKKGTLTLREEEIIRQNGSAWGCDVCQTACPYTKSAMESGSIFTPISYFHENRIERLSEDIINDLSEEEFKKRAFSWRGRDVPLRNIRILKK